MTTISYFNLKIIITSLIVICTAYLFLVIYPTANLKTILSDLFKRELSTKMATASGESWKNAKTVYEFQAKDIDGNLVDLSKYK